MKKAFLYIQSTSYILAGVNHFVHPPFYLHVMPAWMPWHMLLVNISGVAEVLLGIFLIPLSTRRSAAWLIVAMLVAFLVLIHIPMTVDYADRHDPLLWLIIARLPLQLVLIAWAFVYTKSA